MAGKDRGCRANSRRRSRSRDKKRKRSDSGRRARRTEDKKDRRGRSKSGSRDRRSAGKRARSKAKKGGRRRDKSSSQEKSPERKRTRGSDRDRDRDRDRRGRDRTRERKDNGRAASSPRAPPREVRNALKVKQGRRRRRDPSDDRSSDEAGVEVKESSSSAEVVEDDDSEDEEVSACTGQTPEEDEDQEEEDSEEESSGSYYTDDSTPAPAPKPERKEDITHFEWEEGMLLKNRFKVVKFLGDGTFGRVLLAEDQKKKRPVAIKVIREIEKYVRNAKREAEILKDIREAEEAKKPNTSGCVVMYDTFLHESRIFCLAFEPMGASLYDVLKKNRFRGFWVQDIQSVAKQMLDALAFLHDGLNLTHTDLKLENVLFQSTAPGVAATFPREAAFLERHKSHVGKPVNYLRPHDSRIKLIDFGNATYELEHHSSIINTRQYRAPEVILALGWAETSDLWSTGCILMELYTGELLFRTHDSLEHLALMEKIIDRFPQGMFSGASEARKVACLEQDGDDGPWHLRWPPEFDASSPSAITSDPEKCAKHTQHVANQEPLKTLVLKPHRLLADFVLALLRPEPKNRLGATDSLKHAFLSERYED